MKHYIMALAALSLSNTVAAQTDFPVERFRLSSDRAGILDVESADVAPHKSYDFALWGGYADDPLTVYRTVNGNRERVGDLVSHRVGAGIMGAFSLWDRIQLGIEIPLILSQGQDLAAGIGGGVDKIGLGDIRLYPKLQLLRSEKHKVDLSVMVGITLPTGTSSDFFGDKGLTFIPELLISKPFGDMTETGLQKYRIGFNVGYRARKNKQLVNLSVQDELYLKAGIGVFVTDTVEVDGTFTYATHAAAPFGDFNGNHAEAKLGASWHINKFVLFAAGGVGLAQGFGTPDWRALVGIRFGDRKASNDRDRDGIIDSEDRCPDVKGPRSNEGCPAEPGDIDGDGIMDADDKCPKKPEDVDTYEDDDGCPDPDNDKDTVLDVDDSCPLVPGKVSAQGCPDRDGDTVVDNKDNCPDEPGKVEYMGCNDEQFVRITDGGLEIIGKVHFKTNKATIRKKSYALLNNVARVLQNHPEITGVTVEGHTDSRGSEESNLSLSQRRAESVRRYLIGKGVSESLLTAKGYGETNPIESNDTNEGRSANRRVEFRLEGAEIQRNNNGPSSDTFD